MKKMMTWSAGLSAMCLMFAVVACQENPTSEVDVDRGLFIKPGMENTVPGVMFIGNCTATAVSDTTLVTAAHCIERNSVGGRSSFANDKVNVDVCVRSGGLSGTCTREVFAPDRYMQTNDYKYDVAVAVFPPNTFKDIFEVQTAAVRVGDRVLMVGYSEDNLNDPAATSSKRWGTNRVSSVNSQEITTSFGFSNDSVALGRGDSGGPLLGGCKVTGVASRVNVIPESRGKESYHANLTNADVVTFLRSLESRGATFCGMTTGHNQQRCAGRIARPTTDESALDNGQKMFPCAAAQAIGPVGAVYAAVSGEGDSPEVHLSFVKASTFAVCPGAVACDKGEMPLVDVKLADSRAILRLVDPKVAFNGDSAVVTAIARGPSNEILAKEVLTIRRKR